MASTYPIRAMIARQAALAHVSIAKAGLGVQVTYKARQASIPVWAMPKSGGGEEIKITVGTRTISKHRTFQIAMQTGFPDAVLGLTVDDVIEDENGDPYQVEDFVNEDDLGAIYEFHCQYLKTKQIGVVGQ